MIPYGKQDISDDDIKAVVEVLRSDNLTQGPVVPKFEEAIADYCNVNHAIAVNSATSALHIACISLGVGNNDIVWTTPITFVASSNCAIYCGAKVDFVDIDPMTYNMSINALKIKLEKAEKKGKLPKVVIPVHLSGQSCEMKEIFDLSKKYGFRIIEDASHAIGGKYLNEPIGNCKFCDITIFSFHPVKVITSGEGGMAVTNNISLATELYRLRSHGIVRHPSELTSVSDGPWYYQQVSLGYNYRMSDIHAALGLSQLNRLNEFVNKRHEVVNFYNQTFTEDWIQKPYQHPDTFSGLHLYIIRIKEKNKTISHIQLFERLRSAGILVNLHYIPIYRHPYYQNFGYDISEYPESEKYYSEAISLPLYTNITDEQLVTIVNLIKNPIGFQNLF